MRGTGSGAMVDQASVNDFQRGSSMSTTTATETVVATGDAAAAIAANSWPRAFLKANADETSRLSHVLARRSRTTPSPPVLSRRVGALGRRERMYRLIFVPDHVGYGEAYTLETMRE